MGQRYEFAEFVLDPQEGLLLRSNEPLKATPRLLALLEALVDRRGRLVEKKELLDRVWEGTSVSEANLTVQVSKLRRLLGETEERVFIETVPTRGYRFLVPVRILPPAVTAAVPLRRPVTEHDVARRRRPCRPRLRHRRATRRPSRGALSGGGHGDSRPSSSPLPASPGWLPAVTFVSLAGRPVAGRDVGAAVGASVTSAPDAILRLTSQRRGRLGAGRGRPTVGPWRSSAIATASRRSTCWRSIGGMSRPRRVRTSGPAARAVLVARRQSPRVRVSARWAGRYLRRRRAMAATSGSWRRSRRTSSIPSGPRTVDTWPTASSAAASGRCESSTSTSTAPRLDAHSLDGRDRPAGRRRCPRWSPDGRRLAVSRWRDVPRTTTSGSIPLDGSPPTPVVESDAGKFDPAWSPDGRRLAFDTGDGLVVVDVETKEAADVASTDRNDRRPSWSPDGRSLVVESGRDGNAEIYLVPVAPTPEPSDEAQRLARSRLPTGIRRGRGTARASRSPAPATAVRAGAMRSPGCASAW